MVEVYTPNRSYKNILTFSLVVEAIILVIFALLAVPKILQYAPFLITLGVGMLAILIWAIISSRRKIEKMKTERSLLENTKVSNVPCPDYWTREEGDMCRNYYQTPDQKVKYEFLDPSTMQPLSDVDLGSLFGDQALQDVCSANFVGEGSKRPWTAVKPQCMNINDSLKEAYK